MASAVGSEQLPACRHSPQCPPADATDHDAARVVHGHPEQGWSLLCNGVVLFEDLGELFPDGHAEKARRIPVQRLRLSAATRSVRASARRAIIPAA